MGHRWFWSLAAVVLLLCAVAGLRSCRDGDAADGVATPGTVAPAARGNAGDTVDMDAAASQRALIARRNEAMSSAV